MFLGHYSFPGEAALLETAYARLLETLPPESIALQVAVSTPEGLDVWDACPDRETFERFSTSPDFHDALRAAGLPTPAITPLGETAAAIVEGRRLA